jgi:NAD(P)H-dependent FMN reductase
MKIAIVSGSHRNPSQSLKVANFIKVTLEQQKLCDEAELINLGDNPLPLWEESIWSGDEKWQALLNPLHAKLQSADAFVIVTPEWHGQVPAGLKNFFLLCGSKEVGHKPAMLVSLSSVDGGAVPIAELRMSSYKNNRICYIPEQIVVRNVETVLNENPEDNNTEADAYFRERINWALAILNQYALAFTQIRASGLTFKEEFANGM